MLQSTEAAAADHPETPMRSPLMKVHAHPPCVNCSLSKYTMPPILGKRKRRDQIATSEPDSEPKSDRQVSQRLQDLLQQHFEAKFKPLEGLDQKLPTLQQDRAHSLENETESDWTGILEGDEEDSAQVVHYDIAQSSKPIVPKEELKIFMVRVDFSILVLVLPG